MYFKLSKTTPLAAALDTILEKRVHQNTRLSDLAKELSGIDDGKFILQQRHLSGILLAIEFKSEPGKDWVELKKHGDFPRRYFYPRSTAKKLWAQFRSANAEDPVKETALAELFGLPFGFTDFDEDEGKCYRYRTPRIIETDEVWILEIAARWYSKISAPQPDLVEITESEYIKLKASKTLAP